MCRLPEFLSSPRWPSAGLGGGGLLQGEGAHILICMLGLGRPLDLELCVGIFWGPCGKRDSCDVMEKRGPFASRKGHR